MFKILFVVKTFFAVKNGEVRLILIFDIFHNLKKSLFFIADGSPNSYSLGESIMSSFAGLL